MPDRSHLIRTTITDKRGRQTTVYRRPGTETRKSVPAPPPPAPAPDPSASSAELQPPTERSLMEITMTLNSMAAYLPGVGVDPVKVVRRERGRYATRIAMDLIENSELLKDDALSVLAHSHAEHDTPLAADALRVAAALWDRLGPDRMPSDWTATVVQALRGATRPSSAGWDYKGATSQVELDGLSLIAEFIVRVPRPNGVVGYFARRPQEPSLFIPTELESFLRERPQDLDRVLDYAAGADLNRNGPEAIHQLRAHLDSDAHTSLLGGWL